MTSTELIAQYYAAFNARNWQGMLDLLAPDIRHEVNQGEPRLGKDLYARFLQHMDDCYDETLRDIVIMGEPTGRRVAAEFVVHGIYKKGEADLPPAHGQTYVLPAGAFFDLENGLITRVSTYYNLPLWIKLVS
jgi:steroid delta-isomerase-like uncharacterized protein